jgi:hypothetical protein
MPINHPLKQSFDHTGETYIIMDYSFGFTLNDVSKRLKDRINDFWQNSSPQNLKNIFSVFIEKKKR